MAWDFEDLDGDCNESQPGSDDSSWSIHDQILYEDAMHDLDAEDEDAAKAA